MPQKRLTMMRAVLLAFVVIITCLVSFVWFLNQVVTADESKIRNVDTGELIRDCRALIRTSYAHVDNEALRPFHDRSDWDWYVLPPSVMGLDPYAASLRVGPWGRHLQIKLSLWTSNYIMAFEEGKTGTGDFMLEDGLWVVGPVAWKWKE